MSIGRTILCDKHRAERNEKIRYDNEYYAEHGEYPKVKIGQRLLQIAMEPVCQDCKYGGV